MDWNPWKLTAIGMALVVVTALTTGLVVASRTGREADHPGAAPVRAETEKSLRVPSVPTRTAVADCNEYAAARAGSRDKTTEVVKDTAIGALLGAAVGAAGGAVADGGSGAGKGAAIGGIVGAGGGTLYGLNDNRRHDEVYRDAYARCMASRGYRG